MRGNGKYFDVTSNQKTIHLSPTEKLRFWRRVIRTRGCWRYTGSWAGRCAYGQVKFRRNGKWGSYQAHRVAYELVIGPIPAGLVVDHKCQVPSCVNPRHLTPMTNWENGQLGMSPAALNSRKKICKWGHDALYMRNRGNRDCRVCQRKRQKLYRWRRKRRINKETNSHGTNKRRT